MFGSARREFWHRGISADDFVLIDNRGQRHGISKTILRKSTFFANLFLKAPNVTEWATKASAESIYEFELYLRDENPRSYPNDTFDAMVFARSIDNKNFAQWCARRAADITIPESASRKLICSVITEFITALPARTFEHYRPLLAQCVDVDVRRSLRDGIIAALAKQARVYKPLRLPLTEIEAVVGLLNDIDGNPMVAVLRSAKWIKVDIFGPTFCPFKAGVRRFHLRFNEYVVYETSDGLVMKKDLFVDKPAELLLANCCHFESRVNSLVVIHRDRPNRMDVVYEWSHKTVRFVARLTYPILSLVTASKIDEYLMVTLTDGKLIYLLDDGYQENPAKVKRWQRLTEGPLYHVFGGKKSTVSFCHIGYTLLEIKQIDETSYQTLEYTEITPANCGYAASHRHGRVITTSDVLLV